MKHKLFIAEKNGNFYTIFETVYSEVLDHTSRHPVTSGGHTTLAKAQKQALSLSRETGIQTEDLTPRKVERLYL